MTSVESNHERVARIASDLVAIDSVNPSLGGPPGGERRVAEHIGELCRAIGCEVELEEVLPGRPNVVASLHRGDGYPTLVIEGHTDTVGPFLAPKLADGRLGGRGSCDTKGGVAAALHALELVAALDLHLNVTFAGTVDEEVAFRGVTHFLAHHRPPEEAIVIEPTSLVPVVAHAGVLRGELRGAIADLADTLPALQSWAEAREPNEHELCGRTSFSVTTISGGSNGCAAGFDWRLHPADDPAAARAALTASLGESVSLAAVSLMDGGLDLDVQHPLVRACRQVTGARAAGLRAGTDASKFARAGVPAVVLGPGSLDQAHTADEWVDLAEVARAADVYLALCRELAA
jgi:acetylornithine deacetylase